MTIKYKFLNMVYNHMRNYAKEIVLPKYEHTKHHSYGIGPLHGYQTLSWYPRDTEERFNENWANPKQRALLEKCGWTKTNIEYSSNRQGFRMDLDLNEVKPGSHDFYLGCSMTFGVGVNAEDTWPHQMSKRLDRPGLNFGVPGGSIESQYRILRCWAPVLKPKRVYTLGTYLGRRELLEDNIPLNVGNPARAWQNFVENPRHELYWHSEIQISHVRAYDAMRAVCLDYGIELYSICDSKRKEIFLGLHGYTDGRDLIHPGPIWHSQIAQLSDDCWERLA